MTTLAKIMEKFVQKFRVYIFAGILRFSLRFLDFSRLDSNRPNSSEKHFLSSGEEGGGAIKSTKTVIHLVLQDRLFAIYLSYLKNISQIDWSW